MENKNFLSRITNELNDGCNPQKVSSIEIEAMNYYSNKINSSLIPLNLGDVPFVIAALEFLSMNLRKTYPIACGYADELRNSANADFVAIQVNKNALEEFL